MDWLRARASAFAYAGRGLAVLVRQPNAQIHLVAAVLVVVAGLVLGVSARDWIVLVFAIALVLAAEAINTALERVVDLASPDWSPLARDAKDVAAAGVLICAIGAAVIGFLVFRPYLFG